MSIETRLEELTKAINELPSAIAAVLGTAGQTQARTPAEKSDSDQASNSTSNSTKSGKDNPPDTSGAEVAGRKTYVFSKTTKTGQIIEKGEELPEGDEFVKVGKTNWEKLCDKHGLDPETGNAVEEEKDDDDLSDLDEETEEEGEQEEAGEDSDDDDDLGLEEDDDDEAGIDPAEVKKRMVRVMKEVGREDAMKVFKKFGARNFDEIKPEDLQGVYDLAGKVLKKAGK